MLWDDLVRPAQEPEDGVAVRDHAGVLWYAHELTLGMRRDTGDRFLVFESQDALRRVWAYPSDWATRPATELVRLLEAP